MSDEEVKKVKDAAEATDAAKPKNSADKSGLGSDKEQTHAILNQHDKTVTKVTDTTDFGSVVIDTGKKDAADKTADKTDKAVDKPLQADPIDKAAVRAEYKIPRLEPKEIAAVKDDTSGAPSSKSDVALTPVEIDKTNVVTDNGSPKQIETAAKDVNAKDVIAKDANEPPVNNGTDPKGDINFAPPPLENGGKSTTEISAPTPDQVRSAVGDPAKMAALQEQINTNSQIIMAKANADEAARVKAANTSVFPSGRVVDSGLPPISGETYFGPDERAAAAAAATDISSKEDLKTGVSGTKKSSLDEPAKLSLDAGVKAGNPGLDIGLPPLSKAVDVNPPGADKVTAIETVESAKAPDTKAVYPTYDAAGRVLASQDASGNVSSFKYDTDGSVQELRADGTATVTAPDKSKKDFDKDGKPIRTISASGETSTFTYDQKKLVEVNGPLGDYKQNADGSWVGPRADIAKVQVDPDSGSVLYDFKDGSTVNRKIDGSRTEFDSDGASSRKYNPQGQLTDMWSPSGDYSSFKYENGKVSEMTLYQGMAGGADKAPQVFKPATPGGALVDAGKTYKSVEVDPKTGDITYTGANGDKAVQHQDGRRDATIGVAPADVKTFSDKNGNIVKVSNSLGDSTFKYDHNRVIETSGPLGTFKQKADGTWDGPVAGVKDVAVKPDGLLGLTLQDGTHVDRSADGSRTETSADQLSVKKYDAKGALTQMWAANGDYMNFEYNDKGERTAMNLWPYESAGAYEHTAQRYIADVPGGPMHDSARSTLTTVDDKTGDVTMKVGNRTELTHLDGREQVTIDGKPNPTQTFTDQSGNIVKSINETGAVSTFEYKDGKISKATLPSLGDLTVQADGSFSNGKTSISSLRAYDNGSVGYKDASGLDTTVDTAGNRTVIDKDSTKTFDQNGRLSQMYETKDGGTSYSFHYDASGALDQVTNKSGTWNREGAVRPDGTSDWVNPNVPDFKWQGKNSTDGGIYTHTRVNVDKSEVKKDSADRIVSVTNANGSQYKYNRDASGAVTGIDYSPDGKVFSKLNTQGSKTEIGDNGLAKVTDASGLVTTFAADGHFTKNDKSGLLVAQSDTKGTVYSYDKTGQINSIASGNSTLDHKSDGSWQKTVTGPDGVAKVDSKFSFNGQITLDGRNQQWVSSDGAYKKTVTPWGGTTESYIGADGQLAKQIETNKSNRLESYYSGGKLVSLVAKDPTSGRINSISDNGSPPVKTTVQYDSTGKIASITDGGGNKTLVNASQNIKVESSGTITVTDTANHSQLVFNASGKSVINTLDNSKDVYNASGNYMMHVNGGAAVSTSGDTSALRQPGPQARPRLSAPETTTAILQATDQSVLQKSAAPPPPTSDRTIAERKPSLSGSDLASTKATTDGVPVVARPVADMQISADAGKNIQRDIATPLDKAAPSATPEAKVVYPVLDQAGHILQSQDTKGNVTSFKYDADGKPAEVVGTMGDLKFNPTTKSWEGVDKAGAPVHLSDVKFDNAGNIDMKLADGSRRELRADGSSTLTGADSSVRETDKLGNTIKTVNAAGETSTFKYEKDKLVEVNGPLGAYKLNADGTWAGPRGDVAKIQVDPENGNVLFNFKDGSLLNRKMDGSRTEFDSDGISSRKYDPQGKLTEMWSPNGDYASFKYDDKGNRSEMSLWQAHAAAGDVQPKVFKPETPGGPLVDADKKFKSIDVNPKNGDITYIALNDNKSVQHLDGRRDETIGKEPNAVKTFSDKDGRIIQVTSASGENTTFKYEGDKLVESTGPLGTLKLKADGTWDVPAGMASLDKVGVRADGSLALTFKDGTHLDRAADGSRTESSADQLSIRKYDSKGLLTQMWAANGDYATFDYNDKGERTGMKLWPYEAAGGAYSDKPQVYTATVPGGPMQDAGKASTVTVDPKTGDVLMKIGGRTELTHLDGREEITIAGKPNPTQTFSDKNGNIVKSIDSNGSVSTFEYKDGKLTKAVLPSLGEMTLQADGTFSNGKDSVTALKALDNGSISYKDAKGADTIVDTSGNRFVTDKDSQKSFDAAGRMTQMLDLKDGTLYKFQYDAKGDLNQVTNKSGTWSRVGEVNADGVASWVNPARPEFTWVGKNSTAGGEYTFTRLNNDKSEVKRDKNDRVIGVTNADGSQYKYSRSADGTVTGIQFSPDGKTFSKLDTKGSKIEIGDSGLAKVTDAKGVVTNYGNDGNFTRTDGTGHLIAQSDSKGAVYSYDASGQLSSIRTGSSLLEHKADGSWQKSNIGADGTTKVDTKFSFNGQIALDPVTGTQVWNSKDGTYNKVVYPWGATTENFKGADGSVIKHVESNKLAITESNFVNGQLVSTVEKDGKTGRITSISDGGIPPNRNVTTLQYDTSGKLTSITDAGGNKTPITASQSIKVDSSGVMTITDAANHTQTIVNSTGKTIINTLDNSKDIYSASGIYLVHFGAMSKADTSQSGGNDNADQSQSREPRPVVATVDQPAHTATDVKVAPTQTNSPTDTHSPSPDVKAPTTDIKIIPDATKVQAPITNAPVAVTTGNAPTNAATPVVVDHPTGPPPPPTMDKLISTDRPVVVAPPVETKASQAPAPVVIQAPVEVAKNTQSPAPVIQTTVDTHTPAAPQPTTQTQANQPAPDLAKVASPAPVVQTTVDVSKQTSTPVVQTTVDVSKQTSAPVVQTTTVDVSKQTSAPVVQTTTVDVSKQTSAPVVQTTVDAGKSPTTSQVVQAPITLDRTASSAPQVVPVVPGDKIVVAGSTVVTSTGQGAQPVTTVNNSPSVSVADTGKTADVKQSTAPVPGNIVVSVVSSTTLSRDTSSATPTEVVKTAPVPVTIVSGNQTNTSISQAPITGTQNASQTTAAANSANSSTSGAVVLGNTGNSSSGVTLTTGAAGNNSSSANLSQQGSGSTTASSLPVNVSVNTGINSGTTGTSGSSTTSGNVIQGSQNATTGAPIGTTVTNGATNTGSLSSATSGGTTSTNVTSSATNSGNLSQQGAGTNSVSNVNAGLGTAGTSGAATASGSNSSTNSGGAVTSSNNSTGNIVSVVGTQPGGAQSTNSPVSSSSSSFNAGSGINQSQQAVGAGSVSSVGQNTGNATGVVVSATTGNANTGNANTGNANTGNANSGSLNTINSNTGTVNTGNVTGNVAAGTGMPNSASTSSSTSNLGSAGIGSSTASQIGVTNSGSINTATTGSATTASGSAGNALSQNTGLGNTANSNTNSSTATNTGSLNTNTSGTSVGGSNNSAANLGSAGSANTTATHTANLASGNTVVGATLNNAGTTSTNTGSTGTGNTVTTAGAGSAGAGNTGTINSGNLSTATTNLGSAGSANTTASHTANIPTGIPASGSVNIGSGAAGLGSANSGPNSSAANSTTINAGTGNANNTPVSIHGTTVAANSSTANAGVANSGSPTSNSTSTAGQVSSGNPNLGSAGSVNATAGHLGTGTLGSGTTATGAVGAGATGNVANVGNTAVVNTGSGTATGAATSVVNTSSGSATSGTGGNIVSSGANAGVQNAGSNVAASPTTNLGSVGSGNTTAGHVGTGANNAPPSGVLNSSTTIVSSGINASGANSSGINSSGTNSSGAISSGANSSGANNAGGNNTLPNSTVPNSTVPNSGATVTGHSNSVSNSGVGGTVANSPNLPASVGGVGSTSGSSGNLATAGSGAATTNSGSMVVTATAGSANVAPGNASVAPGSANLGSAGSANTTAGGHTGVSSGIANTGGSGTASNQSVVTSGGLANGATSGSSSGSGNMSTANIGTANASAVSATPHSGSANAGIANVGATNAGSSNTAGISGVAHAGPASGGSSNQSQQATGGGAVSGVTGSAQTTNVMANGASGPANLGNASGTVTPGNANAVTSSHGAITPVSGGTTTGGASGLNSVAGIGSNSSNLTVNSASPSAVNPAGIANQTSAGAAATHGSQSQQTAGSGSIYPGNLQGANSTSAAGGNVANAALPGQANSGQTTNAAPAGVTNQPSTTAVAGTLSNNINAVPVNNANSVSTTGAQSASNTTPGTTIGAAASQGHSALGSQAQQPASTGNVAGSLTGGTANSVAGGSATSTNIVSTNSSAASNFPGAGNTQAIGTTGAISSNGAPATHNEPSGSGNTAASNTSGSNTNTNNFSQASNSAISSSSAMASGGPNALPDPHGMVSSAASPGSMNVTASAANGGQLNVSAHSGASAAGGTSSTGAISSPSGSSPNASSATGVTSAAGASGVTGATSATAVPSSTSAISSSGTSSSAITPSTGATGATSSLTESGTAGGATAGAVIPAAPVVNNSVNTAAGAANSPLTTANSPVGAVNTDPAVSQTAGSGDPASISANGSITQPSSLPDSSAPIPLTQVPLTGLDPTAEIANSDASGLANIILAANGSDVMESTYPVPTFANNESSHASAARAEEARLEEVRQLEEVRRQQEIVRQEDATRILQDNFNQEENQRQETQRTNQLEQIRAAEQTQLDDQSSNVGASQDLVSDSRDIVSDISSGTAYGAESFAVDNATYNPDVPSALSSTNEATTKIDNAPSDYITQLTSDAGLPQADTSSSNMVNVDLAQVSGSPMASDPAQVQLNDQNVEVRNLTTSAATPDWLNDAASKYGYGAEANSQVVRQFVPPELHTRLDSEPVVSPSASLDNVQNTELMPPVPSTAGAFVESPIEGQQASSAAPGVLGDSNKAPDTIEIKPTISRAENTTSEMVEHTHPQPADAFENTSMPGWLEQATANLGLNSALMHPEKPVEKVHHDHGADKKHGHEHSKPADVSVSSVNAPTSDDNVRVDRVDADINNSIVAGESSSSTPDYSSIDYNAPAYATPDADTSASGQSTDDDQALVNRQIEEQARSLRNSEEERLALLDTEKVRRDDELKMQQEQADKRRRDEEEERHEKDRKHEDKRRSDEILTILALRQQAEAEAKAKSQRISEERQQAQEAVRKDNQQEKYVVRKNDTIVSIARLKFRDPRLADLIYELNKDRIEVRWTEGKRTYFVEVGTILTLPSPKQVREWTARLNNVSSRTSHQGLTAKKSVLADERRANIEKVLGKIREAVDGANGKTYAVRLGDTLRSIAMKHPDLRDVTLWTLLADKNGLTTDTDSKGAPLAVVIRGTSLLIPTPEEIEIFRTGMAPLKPVAQTQTFVGSYGSLFDVATKPCGGCRRLISDSANLCPACGYVFEIMEDPSIESQATTFNIPDGDTTLSLPEHTVIVDNYGEQTTVVDIDKTTLSLPKHDGSKSEAPKSSSTTGDGRPSSNLSQRTLDDRSSAVEISRIIEDLNPVCRLVKTERELEGERFFCQQLQVLIDEEWTPVLSYEVGHDSSVRHEYSRDGRKKTIKIDLPSGAVGEMVTNELSANWLDYCQRYLAGRKLSA